MRAKNRKARGTIDQKGKRKITELLEIAKVTKTDGRYDHLRGRTPNWFLYTKKEIKNQTKSRTNQFLCLLVVAP